jgi:hypothetical protein
MILNTIDDDDDVVCARDAGKEDTSERIEAAQ